MSIPGAMLLSALIVGLSIFLTTWVFFGGYNNKQKLSVPNPANARKSAQTNTLTSQQLQQIQQQRAQQQQNTPTTVVKPATTTPAKAPVKK